MTMEDLLKNKRMKRIFKGSETMPELDALLEKHSKENFLMFMIKKQINLGSYSSEDEELDAKTHIRMMTDKMAQQDLMRDILMNLPLEDREEMARLKTRNNLW